MHPLSQTRDVQSLLACMARGDEPKFLFFWGHQASKNVTSSCFSQWYDAPFVVNDVRYGTAEHFMMAEKAKLFGDLKTLERILAAADPAQPRSWGVK